ncbi:MAG TPA: (2Fe-2S)-binding protein [candidate division Zixibacteria bacterium]|nr:(2Fe-2S)-binding protein [candidate division Zixibacteria bacterium]
MKINFRLNGEMVTAEISPSNRLLDVLREEFDLTGSKEGCSEGECGACSIIIDGKLANSCIIPAFQADGAEIETIEGISKTEIGKTIIEAFADCGAVQCGFCIPGFVVAGAALLRDNPSPTRDEVVTALSGNLCRCTGYEKIIEGVLEAAKRHEEAK